ncbi:MAG: hypothetical protein ACE5HN_07515, partial [Nitrospiria bacterium]
LLRHSISIRDPDIFIIILLGTIYPSNPARADISRYLAATILWAWVSITETQYYHKVIIFSTARLRSQPEFRVAEKRRTFRKGLS